MKRSLSVLFLTVLFTLTNATGAFAYYVTATCSIASGARLSVTNWDVTGGQTYHMDQNPNATWDSGGIYFDGHLVRGTNDVYKTVPDRVSHNITGLWSDHVVGKKCSVRV